MEEPLEVYIPMDRRQAMARGEFLPDRAAGAALVADISGFTALTEALIQELGPRPGIDELSRQLNLVYEGLIGQLHRLGGSVITFSGDAILCWFNGDAGLRAVTCALAMQRVMDEFAAIHTPGGTTISLAIKVAVTAGPARRFMVGDPQIQYIDVLAGSIVDRLDLAEDQARQGEILAGPEIVDRLGSGCKIAAWRLVADQHFALITGLKTEAPPVPWQALAAAGNRPALDENQTRPWLLPPVYERIKAGQGNFLAELRPAVALFLRFGGLDYDHDDQAGGKLDAYIRWVQNILAYHEGHMIQLVTGDKGSYLYAAFGAPVAHGDDAARAVAAALMLQELPPGLGFITGVQIGLSQGRMRTGAYGSTTQRTFGVLGDEVNVAARLMSQARPGQLLISKKVADAAARNYDFNSLGTVEVKGKQDPIPVFGVSTPLSPVLHPSLQGRDHTELLKRLEQVQRLVGRAEERLILAEQLQALARSHTSGTTIIEGEAGIGKSRLVADLLEQAQTLGLTCLVGAGNPTERSSAYHAWRTIFRQLFELDGQSAENTLARTTSALSALPGSPELQQLLPLLNAVLPLGLPENDLTRQMTGQVRADNTRDLLLNLLGATLDRSPALLILEDAHWLDSASWALARLASQRLQPLLLVIVTRPPAEPLPVEYSQFIRAAGTRRLVLQELSPRETVSLIGQCLGVSRVPEALARLIYTRAEGHPFFSIELAYTLRDAELIHVENGECQAVPDLERLDSTVLPDTIEGVVTTRIDRLNYPQQLTLKIASVIGLTFLYRLLHDVHPITTDRQYLTDYLEKLEKLNITHKEAPAPDLAYTFQHVIIREVAYNLMPFDQRRELHRAVAGWLEQTYAGDLASFYPLLAHHWRLAADGQAGDEATIARAIDYLEKAGEQALNSYANKEAARFFSELLKLDARRTPAGGPAATRSMFGRPARQVRRARWERQLGETYLGLGQLAESQKHFERAAQLIGWPRPAGRVGYGFGLLGQILRQVRHRLWPVSLVKRSPEAQATWLEAARIHERLGEVAYWSNQTIPTAYAALQTLNLAERAEPSPELVRAYASICIAAGFVSLPALANTYRRRALAAAQDLQNRPAQVWVLELIGVHTLGAGHWKLARQALGQAVAICDQIQDRRRWAECLASLNEADYFQGKFSESLAVWPSITTSAGRRDDPQARSWGLAGQLRSLLAMDRLDSAQAGAALADLEALLGEGIGSVDEMSSYGIIARVRLRLGQYDLARQAIETVMGHIGPAAPTVFSVIHGYISVAEVYLALWQAGQSAQAGAEVEDLGRLARLACQALRRYARVFRIGQPRAWLHQGQLEWLTGRPAKAFKAWHKSLAVAQRLAMPYEQGLAHAEIGRHLAPADPHRPVHLTQARAIFSQLDAGYDLGQTQALLA